MMIGALKDRPKASLTDRGDFVVFVVATAVNIVASAEVNEYEETKAEVPSTDTVGAALNGVLDGDA